MKLLEWLVIAWHVYGVPSAYYPAHAERGHLIISKKTSHARRHRRPTAHQLAVWQGTQAQWRRRWHALIASRWKTLTPPYDQAWWETQAYLVFVINYKGQGKYMTGFQFFMWYQNRWLDLYPQKYIPFPANEADFPHEFVPPWVAP